MRKVLIVACHFPPQGGSGTLRVAKFVKYLRDFGWEPIVVCSGYISHCDQALADELPSDLQIHRTWDLHLALRSQKKADLNSTASFSSIPKNSSLLSQWRQTLKGWGQGTLSRMLVPDPNMLFWVPFAYWRACCLIKQNEIDLLFTTSPPHSTQIVGSWLKARYPRIPWVIDLRDLWSQGHVVARGTRYQANYRLQKTCLQQADKVLVVAGSIRRLTLDEFPGADGTKIRTLTNGYDSTDFANLQNPRQNDRFTMLFAGSLHYAESSKNQFVPALFELAENELLRQRIRVRFVGANPESIHGQLQPLCDVGMVTVCPPVPHHEAVAEMLRADVLLLLGWNILEFKLSHTSKLYEYLATGKTILALVPDGEAAKLIRQEEAGTIVDYDDREQIKKAILDLLARFEQGTSTRVVTADKYARFQRRNLTQKLSRIFDECVMGLDNGIA